MTIDVTPKVSAYAAPDRDYRVPYLPVGSKVGAAELEAVSQVLRSGATLSGGAWRARFEEDFRSYVGTPYALSTTSGTVSLELAIHLLDLRPGDEVVVTPQTYQATLQPLFQYPQVRVRFCDVSPDTMNMDPVRLEELVNHRTRAVILVHYGGLPADMQAITAIARAHDAVVIEDSAHAIGSSYQGRRPGSLGDIGCFSFHSSKNITTLGEGGMLTLHNEEWAQRIERLRGNETDAHFVPHLHRFGDSAEALPGALYPGNAYTHDCAALLRHGTNATLSEAAAAVGSVQLAALPELVARRRLIASRLREVLENHADCVELPAEPAGAEQSHHLFTFFVRGPRKIDRDRLVNELRERGVQMILRYFPLHLTPEWRARSHYYGECPVAERLWFHEQVNLPCHPGLSDKETELLCDLLDDALRTVRRDRKQNPC
ncbi:DegT/DnrJ/EryC1/StrS family aminotransferase [Streptomyces sp. NPDC006386]|uniref:DegT/DnrJ/EryC1/StrS aminotransferase family protein n=1 Tax=Streptomyces sp. NPDC006386 TaxID=3156762 RepID=UPI0033A98FBB